MPSVIAAVIVSLRLFNISSAPPSVIDDAQRALMRIYAAIDVDVRWTEDASAPMVIVRDEEPGDLRRAWQPVLGAAIHTPKGSPVAYVFYRRVVDQAIRHDATTASVLASAMAHEVGHLLLPTPNHSHDGLMRGCWDAQEFQRASTGDLRFSAGEGAQIRASIGR
jgi:hypothetical protein